MNAVIYHSPNGRVTGALTDALDYYAALRLDGRGILLVVIGVKREDVLTLMHDRYRHAAALKSGLRFIATRVLLAFTGFQRVLTPYSAYQRVRHFLRAETVYILPSQVLRHHHERGRIHDRSNCVFLLDPHRHPYAVHRREAYRKKLFLADLPEVGASDNAVLISTVSTHKQHRADALTEGLRRCEPFNEAIALSYKRESPLASLRLLRPPVPGFFARFDHYLYLPPLGGYDENPRLVFEARWLGKKLTIVEDGTDPERVEQLRNGPMPVLEPDDPIFSWFPGKEN
ncbi:MAG: hypothetical protein ACFB21_01535 [Opitutales bacterium]